MAKVLIAGCGDIGARLAQKLVAENHHVVAIRRSGTEFPDGVTGVTGDLATMEHEHLPDVALIFLIMTPQERGEAAYRRAYYDTAQNLAQRYSQQAKKPRILFVSSTSVYGQHQGEWIDDRTPAVPNSPTANVLLETEESLAQALPSTSVRCSGIYGPGRFRLLQKVDAGESWGTNSWTNRVHRDDVVSALMVLAEASLLEQDLPEHVIVTDQTPVSMWEVKLWLATQLEANVVIENAEDFVPRAGKRIQGSYLLSIGWKPNYPSYVSGYQALIDEYVKQKKEA